MALELTLDPPPESQEQTIIGDYNTLASQYPDSGAISVATVDEIDDEKYKELTLSDLNAKRVAFEDSFGLKVEPFTSLEDYQERAPLIIETAKKVYLDANSNQSIGDFEQFLAKSLSTAKDNTPKNVQPTVQSEPTQKPFNFNEALGNIPPVGGYGGDVPRETSGKVLEYKLGEAKRKGVEDANQMQSTAFRLRQTNQLPDDQVKVLNALQNNAYQGFVPTDNKNIGLSVYEKPDDDQLEALNIRAGNISEGNLMEAQQIGNALKQLDKEIKDNYTANGLPTPPELINQTLQLQSQWKDKIDKASLFSDASNRGIIERYNRQVEKGNLAGDIVISTFAGLNNLGKGVVNTLATLKPSDILRISGTPNPIQSKKINDFFGYDQNKAKKWIQDFNTKNAKGFDKVFYDLAQLSTPEHKEAQNLFWSTASGIVEMLPPMAISMMADNPYISYSVWAANSYGTRIEEMTKDPRWANASLDEIKAIALPQSLAEAAIMEVGIKDVKGITGLGKAGLDQTSKIYNTLMNAKNSLVPNSGLTGLKKSIIEGGMRTVSGATTAAGTGASVSVVNDLSKNLYNLAMGDVNNGLDIVKQEDGSYDVIDKNNGKLVANEPTEEKANKWKYRFEPVTPTQIIENGVNSAKDWALMGVMMSAPMTIAGTLKGIKVDARDFAFTKSLVEDPFRVSTMYNTIKNDLATGKIDKEEAQLRIDAIKEFKPIADQIPSTLTPENQRKAFDLLNNIKKLEAQKVGKAEGLTGSIDKQIEINKNKLKEIGDAVQDKSKDDYSGSESFLPFTVKEINDGVNYGMKFENTSSDATPKTNDNANNEIQNTESVTTNGQDKVQGQRETNTETIANSVETKNAEVGISESQQVTSKISNNEKGNNEAKPQAKEGDVLKTEVKVGAENAPAIPFIQEVTKNKKAVTLSGNSEVKRQKLIEQRVEKTTLSEGQKSESELAKKVKKFNDMTPSERVKNFRLLNEIKSDAKGRFKVINNGIKGSVEVKAKTKDGGYRNIKVLTSDAGRRSIAPNGKPLHERPQEFQRQFVELIDLGIPFEFRNAEDNSKFKPSQEASALADIYDGIPSEQAEIVLNHIQKAIETNQIEFGDNKQGFGVEQLDKVVAEITQAKNEEAFQSISQKTIEQLYKENSDLQEKFDEIIQQEYENIANGVNEKPTEELARESPTTNDSRSTKGLPNESVVEKVQSQEGLEPPKPPSKPKEGVSGKDNGGILGITHAANEVRRESRQDAEYQKSPQSFEQWNNEAEKWIKDGGDVEALMDRLEKGELGRELPLEVENSVRKIHMATLDAEIRKNPTDELLAKQKRYIEIGDVVNTMLGRSLASLKGEGSPLRSLSDFYVAKMNALGVDKLTDQQKQETEQAFEKVEKTTETADIALQEFKDEVAKLKAEIELLKQSRGISSTRVRKTREDFVSERKSIKESIASKWRNAGKDILSSDIPYRKQLAAIAPDVILLAKSYIEELSIKLEEVSLKKVVKKLHEELIEDIPEITERDIHNIIAGEYNKKSPPRSKLASDMRDLADEARYINKLEAILRGENPKTEKQKAVRNQKIAELQKRIKDLQKDLPKTDAELLQRLEGIKSRNEKAKDKLKERIANKEFETKKEVPFLEDPEMQRKFPKEYKAAVDAILAREDARHEFDIALMEDQKSRRGNIEKATDFLSKSAGTVKAIVTGIDDSAVAIQTYMSTLRRPIVGAQALALHVSHALSEKKFDRWLTLLHNSSDYKLMQDAGLNVTEPKSLMESKKDEIFNNRFDGTIKIKGKEYQLISAPLKPFERAFNTLGNASRVLAFRAKADQYIRDGYTFKSHPELFKSLAERLNTETGRGKQNEYIQKASQVVTMGVWSPGLMAAKFNMLGISDLASIVMSKAGTKGYYRRLHPLERIEAFKDIADFSTAVLAISYGVALAFGGTVDDDPLSSTYLDVKLDNGKSYNFSGGFSSYIRTIAQFAMGKKSKDGEKVDANRLDIAGRFVRGKMPPISAAIANTLVGKDFMGRETSVVNEAKNLLTPISVKGIYKQIERDGTSSLFTQGIPTFFGLNVKDERDFEKKSIYTEDDKQIPAFKYFIDKKVELPSKTFDKIPVKDIPSKTNKFVSDYSEPLQQLYKETHLRIFEKNLQSVINRGYVYKQVGYGESISNTYQKDGVKRKKVMLDDLTKKELEQVLENAERSATNKAKEKVFTRSAQIADGVK